MKQIALFLILSLALVAWPERPIAAMEQSGDNTSPNVRDRIKEAVAPMEQSGDNTGPNIRERIKEAVAPMDQSESATDRIITLRIRQALTSDRALSTDAKKITIITRNGIVILRGPVANADEKTAVEKKVQSLQGVTKIDNQLDVESK